MKNPTRSRKTIDCPVCGRGHGCKTQDDIWVLCLRGTSQQDAPPGYRFVKPLQNDMGGLFVRDDGTNNQNREEWQRDQETKRLQRETERANYQAKLLPVDERDRQYRLVNQDLRLITRHRKALREERKLTDSEIDLAIELGAIRTWNPGQQIIGVSPDLAGINPFTGSLAGVYGIAIYSFDPAGNITGAQVKPDHEGLGKYVWLSSQNKNGNGPHLPNGELPLFVWSHPQSKTISEVWLCEGSLKSLLVALKLWRQGKTDVAVIGTASAARYGEKTLKEYLEQLNCKILRLMPDAGAVNNPAICQANRQTLEWCQRWGYSITIGWWGQVDKSHPDIDELGDFSAIAYLTPEDFLGGYFQKIHPETIEEVRQCADADIVNIVGEHIPLQKRGKDLAGECPFCIVRKSSLFSSPSLIVSGSKQFYNCLDCANSGNAIKFLMELGKHSFRAVVLDLARRYQIPARSAEGDLITLPSAPLTFHKTSSESDRAISESEWQTKFGFPDWFRQQIERFSEAVKGFKPPQLKSIKFKPSVATKRTEDWDSEDGDEALTKILNYIYRPDNPVLSLLPAETHHLGGTGLVIRFKAGQRLHLIAELVALGYKTIFDRSEPGAGKSYDAGLAEPGRFGVDRLWYFSEDHRNPTTATVEANYTDMVVRHDGMKIDPSRRTALNNPHERWPKQGERPDTEGNCFRTKTFHALAAKGYQFDIDVEAKLNPICLSCHAEQTCGKAEAAGPGANYRTERRTVFTSDRIRASLDSAPSPEALLPKKSKDNPDKEITNGAFVDEAMRLLSATTNIDAHLSDFDQVWGEIESKLPEVHEQLKPFRLALRPILAAEIKPTQQTYHGWGDAAIREILGTVPENLPEIIRQLELFIKPDLSEILQEPDSFNMDGVDRRDRKDFTKEQSKRIRDAVRQQSYRDTLEAVRNLAANWLVPFLRVWGLVEQGSFQIKDEKLTVTIRDTRHAEVLQAMRFVVLQDATATREDLALYLGIDPATIIQIQQDPSTYDNLTIVRVTGLGSGSRKRSPIQQQKIELATEKLRQEYAKPGSIDHKQYAGPGEGNWFNQNRASNEYLDRDVLIAKGTPFQNIGDLQAEYIALTGDCNVDRDDPEFSGFVRSRVEAEIAQCPGRLRAQRRPEEKLTYISLSDFPLEFLAEHYPGATFQERSSFSIDPTLGTATEQSHWRIVQAVRQLVQEAGVALDKLRQTAVAAAAGVTQGRVAQVASKYGGWKAFKKLLAALFNSIYSPANNFEPLTEEQEFIADAYLPLAAQSEPADAVEVMVDTVKAYGWQVFEAILAATSLQTRGQLVAALISGLPRSLQEEFRAIAKEVPG